MSQDLQTRPQSSSRPDRTAGIKTDPDDVRFDRQPGEPLGRDLLKNQVVSAVMRSR